jgi:hypothetical protein
MHKPTCSGNASSEQVLQAVAAQQKQQHQLYQQVGWSGVRRWARILQEQRVPAHTKKKPLLSCSDSVRSIWSLRPDVDLPLPHLQDLAAQQQAQQAASAAQASAQPAQSTEKPVYSTQPQVARTVGHK